MKSSSCSYCSKGKSLWSRLYNCDVCKQSICGSCLIPVNPRDLILVQGICLRCHKVLTDSSSDDVYLPTELEIQETNLKYLSIISKDPFQDFDLISSIGSGNFSRVYHVRQRDNHKDYALKQLCFGKGDRMQAYNEFIQSVGCQSRNILKNYALYQNEQEYYILQELMHSTISDFIKYNEFVPEEIILYILREILQGLCYMHKNFVIHRDIKSENIFLSFEGEIKIGDFGSVAQLTQERDLRNTLVGTPFYLAPEIVKGESYGTSVDVWSLGILSYELVFKQPLFFECKNFAELFPKIKKFSDDSLTDSEYPRVNEFFRLCLVKNPEERVSCSELLKQTLFEFDSNACKEFIMDYIRRNTKF